ncbi:MAG: ABC transporter substrate-binding protein [Spirochaetaceae bacterium]|jgi:NitT/TauT family transport system substrate-binding protein|nr:ABC transporter substrate-binding protein [Spirochaetaceae bacterium]
MKAKKRMCIIATVLLGIVLLGAGCSKKNAQGKAAGGLELVRLGVMTDTVSAYAADVGVAEGIFAKHGLAVEIASFAAGINTIDAVTTGAMDIGFGADFAVLNRLGGSLSTPLRIFTGLGEGTLDSWKLYAQGDSIRSPSDLAGKRVVTRLGTVEEYWHAKTLAANEVALESVNFLPVDATMEGVVLINNGDAVAMWANARPAEALNRIAGVHVIGDLTEVGVPTLSLAVATEQFLTGRNSAAEKYLRAMQEIFDMLNSDPQKSAEIVQEVSSTPVEHTLINLKNNTNYIDFDQYVFDAIEGLHEWAQVNGVIKYPYDLHKYIDTDALKAAFPGRGEFE